MILLSVGIVANITSVNSFAVDFNMNFSDFSIEIFKLNQSVEKILHNNADISVREKICFLESEGFEQIENILVNGSGSPSLCGKIF